MMTENLIIFEWNQWVRKDDTKAPQFKISNSPHVTECELRNLGKILLVESRIRSFEIQNTAQGIRNPTNDWNTESNFPWQRLGSNTCKPASRAWNSKSKTVLDSLIWGEVTNTMIEKIKWESLYATYSAYMRNSTAHCFAAVDGWSKGNKENHHRKCQLTRSHL